MRAVVAVMLLLMLPWLLGSQNTSWAGVAGGLMILAVPALVLRGVWLLAGDVRRFGGGKR